MGDNRIPEGDRCLIFAITLSECIKNKLDSSRNSQFFENPREVVPRLAQIAQSSVPVAATVANAGFEARNMRMRWSHLASDLSAPDHK